MTGHRSDSSCRDHCQLRTDILARRAPASAAVKAAGIRRAQGQPAPWFAASDVPAKLLSPTAIEHPRNGA